MEELTIVSGKSCALQGLDGEDDVERDDKPHLGNCGSALDAGRQSTGFALGSGFEGHSNSGTGG